MGKPYSAIQDSRTFIENMPKWWEPVGRWQVINLVNTDLYCISLGYDHSAHPAPEEGEGEQEPVGSNTGTSSGVGSVDNRMWWWWWWWGGPH